MPLSEGEKEIRGIHTDYPNNTKRVRITTRDNDGENYEIIDYPNNQPINKGLLKIHVGGHYNIPPGKVIIPKHILIKIPQG